MGEGGGVRGIVVLQDLISVLLVIAFGADFSPLHEYLHIRLLSYTKFIPMFLFSVIFYYFFACPSPSPLITFLARKLHLFTTGIDWSTICCK